MAAYGLHSSTPPSYHTLSLNSLKAYLYINSGVSLTWLGPHVLNAVQNIIIHDRND